MRSNFDKMTEMDIYFKFFPLWFEKYSKKIGSNLFAAGKNCNYVMNLIRNPFVVGTNEYEPQWDDICTYFLMIDPYDEEARKSLVRSVIRFAQQEYYVNKYVITKTVNEVETKEILYYIEEENKYESNNSL